MTARGCPRKGRRCRWSVRIGHRSVGLEGRVSLSEWGALFCGTPPKALSWEGEKTWVSLEDLKRPTVPSPL